jgi:hypothetical protein
MDSAHPVINWGNLTRSLDHYTRLGFMYLEVPWIVPSEITHATFHGRDNGFVTDYGDLVGSAEQSFLYLHTVGKLPPGRYCALTPCFRNEPILDTLHQQYFMKLELIQTDVVSSFELMNLVSECAGWFNDLIGDGTKIIATPEGFDITYHDIELGSYGIRAHNGFRWIFATGIAEPRFSQAVGK